MSDKESLKAYAEGKQLDQATIRQLMRAGLITADDVTTLDTPGQGRVYLPTGITMRGQQLLVS
jgi:hypothetical protein